MVKARRVAPLLLLGTLLAACGASACAAVFGFDRLSEEESTEGGLPEAATPETSTPAPEAGASCTALGIPDRPAPSDAGADAPGPIHMALNLVDFGIGESAVAGGFNLDHACSPTVATSSCTTAIDVGTFDKYGKDRDESGIDNASFGLFGYLSYLGSAFAPVGINKRLTEGEFGLVLRIANWNGTPEDDDVIVELFPAIGLLTPVDGGAPVPGGKPSLTASDVWRRDRRYQNIVDASRIKSASAWVTGGRMVASFQSVTFPLSVPEDPKPIDITLQEAVVTGMMVADGASWRLSQAVVGGRWRTVDMLAEARMIYVKDTAGLVDSVLCDPGAPTIVYGAVKKEVCDARDIRGASRDDGKSLPCDSFSAGVRFDTYAVDTVGPFDDLPAITPRCEKDGSVPVKDDCAVAFP